MLPPLIDEQDVYEIPGHGITLTTKRLVQYLDGGSSNFSCKTILVRDVSFCGVVGTANNMLLYLGVIFAGFFFYGFVREEVQVELLNPYCISLLIGLGFFIAYLLSKKKIVRIASSGGSITFQPNKISKYELYDLFTAIQQVR